jgi:hypothetical protein
MSERLLPRGVADGLEEGDLELGVGRAETAVGGVKEEAEEDECEKEVEVEQLVDPAIWATYREVVTAILVRHSDKYNQGQRETYIREALAWVFSLCICRGMEPDKAREWLGLLMDLVVDDLVPKEPNGSRDREPVGFLGSRGKNGGNSR